MSTVTVVAAAVAAGLGALAGLSRPGGAVTFTLLTLATLGAAGLARKTAAGVVLVAVTVGLGAAADASWRARASAAGVLPSLASQREDVRICGTVLERGPRSLKVSAREVYSDGHRWRVREPVRLVTEDGVRAGQRVCAAGPAKPAREQGEPPLVVADSKLRRAGIGSPLRFAAAITRERFSDAAQRVLPRRQAGLLLGMTDGDTELLDEPTLEAFRTTGLAHLVAVSGANVAVVLALVLIGVRLLLRRGRWLRVLLATPPLVLFAFLTNLEPSVLRATVTAGLVLAATASGRTAEGLRATAVAFVALVLLSPEVITSPGFQLSFGATLGLVLWASSLTRRLARLFDPRGPGPPATAVAAAIGTTLAAQLAVAPLLAWHFGRIPAFGGVANLLVVPLAPLVTVGGLLTLGLATAWSAFGWAPALLRLPLDAILAAARGFAALPGASVAIGPPAAIAVVLGLVAAWGRVPRLRLIAGAAAILTGAAACGHASAGRSSCDGPEVRVLDVGQGTAVLLREGSRTVLVDGGPASGRVVRSLRAAGVRSIDLAVISHPHADHTEGLIETIRRMPVKALVAASNIGWGVGDELLREARRRDIPVRHVGAGASFALGPRLHVEVLAPEPGPPPEESDDAINSLSLVLRARVGGLSVLLPGDIDTEGSAALLESGRHVEARILIAPHHGSADVETRFVEAVRPRMTIVTVGSHNRYGHPSKRALRLYERSGSVLRTDTDGAIGVCVGDRGAEVTSAR